MSNTTEEVKMDDETMTEEERRMADEMAAEPDADTGAASGVEQYHQELENERRSLADLAAEEPAAEEETPQYTLFGTAPQVNAKVTGTKNVSSTVKFKSKQEVLPGQFQVDDMVELRVLARVDGLDFSTKRDADGAIMSTTRVHKMTLVSIEQVGDVDDTFTKVDGRDGREQ